MKKCNVCNIEKNLSSFPKKKGKLRSLCKECHNAANKKWYYRVGKNWRLSYNREYKLNNPTIFLYKEAKRRSKKHNLPFDITAEDIIIPNICPVLGMPLKAGDKIACDSSPSLDRIKPELGYVKGNIQVISYRANTLKNNATIEELEKVLEHLRNIV